LRSPVTGNADQRLGQQQEAGDDGRGEQSPAVVEDAPVPRSADAVDDRPDNCHHHEQRARGGFAALTVQWWQLRNQAAMAISTARRKSLRCRITSGAISGRTSNADPAAKTALTSNPTGMAT
jgi:hypothetical protein